MKKNSLKIGAALFSAVSLATHNKEDLSYDPVDTSIKIIRSVAEGFKLYEHVNSLKICDFNSQIFASTLVDSLSLFAHAHSDTEYYREGLWLFTDSLGLFSYVLRSCYTSLIDLNEL